MLDFTAGSTTYRRDCGRWADGAADLEWDGTNGTISRFTLKDQGACNIAHSSAGASFMPIKDDYGAVDALIADDLLHALVTRSLNCLL